MSLAAPPRQPASYEPDDVEAPAPQEALDALIEEARRRARRRRGGYGALAFASVSAAAVIAIALSGADDGASPAARPPTDASPPASAATLDRAALREGNLTLIDYSGGAEPPHRRGWYDMFVLDRGKGLRPFVRCPDRVDYCGLMEALDWSPNGRRLAFTVGAHGAINPNIGLHVLDVATGQERRIHDGSVCAYVDRSDLAWSPDGSRVAYVCTTLPGRRRAIVLVDPSGRVRRLDVRSTGTVSSPTWSSSGQRIAYATKAAGADPAIVVTDLGGFDTTIVARNGTTPDWSPDGTTIAYRAGCGGIKLVTPEGRDVTPVRGPFRCRALGVPGTPVWTPDGRQITISNRSGIYLIDRDGSRLRRLTRHTGIGPHGGRPAWRP